MAGRIVLYMIEAGVNVNVKLSDQRHGFWLGKGDFCVVPQKLVSYQVGLSFRSKVQIWSSKADQKSEGIFIATSSCLPYLPEVRAKFETGCKKKKCQQICWHLGMVKKKLLKTLFESDTHQCCYDKNKCVPWGIHSQLVALLSYSLWVWAMS